MGVYYSHVRTCHVTSCHVGGGASPEARATGHHPSRRALAPPWRFSPLVLHRESPSVPSLPASNEVRRRRSPSLCVSSLSPLVLVRQPMEPTRFLSAGRSCRDRVGGDTVATDGGRSIRFHWFRSIRPADGIDLQQPVPLLLCLHNLLPASSQ
jgi:hypothetical protein